MEGLAGVSGCGGSWAAGAGTSVGTDASTGGGAGTDGVVEAGGDGTGGGAGVGSAGRFSDGPGAVPLSDGPSEATATDTIKLNEIVRAAMTPAIARLSSGLTSPD